MECGQTSVNQTMICMDSHSKFHRNLFLFWSCSGGSTIAHSITLSDSLDSIQSVIRQHCYTSVNVWSWVKQKLTVKNGFGIFNAQFLH